MFLLQCRDFTFEEVNSVGGGGQFLSDVTAIFPQPSTDVVHSSVSLLFVQD
jgi:hypothetical protein